MKKEIMLTTQEFKDLRATGVCSHKYGGIVYDVALNDESRPVVVGTRVLAEDYPLVNFPGAMQFGGKIYR